MNDRKVFIKTFESRLAGNMLNFKNQDLESSSRIYIMLKTKCDWSNVFAINVHEKDFVHFNLKNFMEIKKNTRCSIQGVIPGLGSRGYNTKDQDHFEFDVTFCCRIYLKMENALK